MSTNPVIERASVYVETHKVFELFERLVQDLVVQQPANPIQFVIDSLKRPRIVTVIIAGGPGSGKGTQCERIVKVRREPSARAAGPPPWEKAAAMGANGDNRRSLDLCADAACAPAFLAAQELGCVHVSTGDIMREAVKVRLLRSPLRAAQRYRY